MKALIFAAGRGERMRPLTDTTPKPLLKIAGKALIEYSIESLARAGFHEIVINLAYLGRQIQAYCGNGSRWGLNIIYSDEGDTALETAGGIIHALPLLGKEPFLAINSDILCDYPLANLRNKAVDGLHLVMIDNPAHHTGGDFHLHAAGYLATKGDPKLTFSGIGLYHPALFRDLPCAPLKLRPIIEKAISDHRATGEYFAGRWLDIGTPQRLAVIDAEGW